jgi:hypothetical protein
MSVVATETPLPWKVWKAQADGVMLMRPGGVVYVHRRNGEVIGPLAAGRFDWQLAGDAHDILHYMGSDAFESWVRENYSLAREEVAAEKALFPHYPAPERPYAPSAVPVSKATPWQAWDGRYDPEDPFPVGIYASTWVYLHRRNGRVTGPYEAGRIEWFHSNTPSDIIHYMERGSARQFEGKKPPAPVDYIVPEEYRAKPVVDAAKIIALQDAVENLSRLVRARYDKWDPAINDALAKAQAAVDGSKT